MNDLLEAVQIFLTQGDVKFPFHCEHDCLHVWGYEDKEFTEGQTKRLEELGFHRDEDDGHFYSFKYGSC